MSSVPTATTLSPSSKLSVTSPNSSQAIEKPQKQSLSPSVELLSNLTGGFCGSASIYPINVMIGRIQRDKIKTNIFKIFREEGFLGLYKGFTPRGVATAFEKTLKVQVNGHALLLLQAYESKYPNVFNDIHSRILAGASAGVAQALLVTNAMERISLIMGTHGIGNKERMKLTEAFSIAFQTGGLWKGVGPCLMRDAPFSAIYFPLYSILKDQYDLGSFLAGGIAGGISAATVTPADVIKTRMQTTVHNTFSAATASIHAQGLSTYFTGAGLRAMRSSIQFAVNFYILETLNRHFSSEI